MVAASGMLQYFHTRMERVLLEKSANKFWYSLVGIQELENILMTFPARWKFSNERPLVWPRKEASRAHKVGRSLGRRDRGCRSSVVGEQHAFGIQPDAIDLARVPALNSLPDFLHFVHFQFLTDLPRLMKLLSKVFDINPMEGHLI